MITAKADMRLENWEMQLSNYLEKIRFSPFVWGRHDCALMAADAVEAITGVDYATDLRGRYTDAKGAKILSPDGLSGHVEKAGFKEINPVFAKRGDLVLAINNGREILGVVDMTGRYVAVPGQSGLVLLQRSAMLRAWEVT